MSNRQITTKFENRQCVDRDLSPARRSPIFAIFDNIRSLHNVGAMFRTADGVNASKVFLCGITGVPPRHEIEKTALGATESVPWEYSDNTVDIVKRLKKDGVKIIGLEICKNSKPYFKAKFKFPACLIVGNEVTGISLEILALCDQVIHIPMLGQKESLNCATAFGIAVYELLRQL